LGIEPQHCCLEEIIEGNRVKSSVEEEEEKYDREQEEDRAAAFSG